MYETPGGNYCVKGDEALPMTRDEAKIIDEQLAREQHRRALDEADQQLPCQRCDGDGKVGAENPFDPNVECPDCFGTGQRPATQEEYDIDSLEQFEVDLFDATARLEKAGDLWAGIIEDARIFRGVIRREITKAKSSKAVAA